MNARPYTPIDPDAGIPDLIRRLADDSRRLVADEVRLARLEVRENLHTGLRGTLWLALAFGAAVVALVAVNVLAVALLGRLFGHAWAGALVTGVVELGIAWLLIRKGLHVVKAPDYTFEASLGSLRDTVRWARNAPRPSPSRRPLLH